MPDNITKQEKRSDLPTFIIPAIVTIYILFYFAYVHKTWLSVADLSGLIPLFVISAISLGMVCACLPLKRPRRSTFLIGALVPFLSTCIYLFLTSFIGIANASPGDIGGSPAVLIFILIFPFITIILHGVLALFGHYIGCKVMLFLSPLYRNYLSDSDFNEGEVEIRAAKLTAYTTFSVGIITTVVSFVITLIG